MANKKTEQETKLGKSQQQDQQMGNLAPNQRGMEDVNREAQLPTPEVLAALTAQNQQAGMAPVQTTGMQERAGLEENGTVYRPAGSRITVEMLKKATNTMHRYRQGKASLERRIIEAQEWWKLKNWEQIKQQEQIRLIPTLVYYHEGEAWESITAPGSKAEIENFLRQQLSR